MASRISREVVQLHAHLYGRGPTRAKTYLTDAYALCVLEDVFTPAEHTLVRAGNAQQVEATRGAFQDAVREEFVSIAEAATGRKVRSFISAVDVGQDLATELFLFEEREDEPAERGEEDSGGG